MNRTPWTKPKSSLPSDRIPPSRKPNQSNQAKGKGKQNEVPKSKEVKRLEELRDGLASLSSSSGVRDPKGGCFCQARTHSLSPYTPLCKSCGLIFCSINSPHFLCPHCSQSLLSSLTRDSLLARIEQELSDTLLKEERDREHLIEEARRAAGAFPTLQGSAPPFNPLGLPSGLDSHPINQSHKVLSLNSKTKKIKVSTKTTPLPTSVSMPSSFPLEPIEKISPRVPKPPSEVPFIDSAQMVKHPGDPTRPWAPFLEDLRVTYVSLPKTPSASVVRDEGGGGGGDGGGKSKGKRNMVVPGSGGRVRGG